MAIKLKSSERKQFRSWLRWGLLLLAVCSFAMMMSYDSAVSEMNGSTEEQYEWTEEADQYQSWPNYNSDPEMNLKSFLRYIYAGSYGMYWELQQKIQQRPLQPSELFLSESTRSAGDYEFFDTNFAAWYSVFGSLMEEYEIKYRIKDTKSGTVYTNAVENLEFYEENEGIFFLKLRYDEEESLMIEAMQNADGFVFETREIQGLTKRRFLSWIGVADMHASLLGQPKNVSIYVYSPNPECYVSRTDRGVENLTMMERYRAIQATTGVWYLVLLAVIAVAVWLFLPFRRMRDEEQLYLKRIPVEAAIAGVILILAGYELAVDFCYNYTFNYQGTFQTVRHFGAYFGLFGVWFLSVQVLLQIQVLGIVHF